MQVGVGVEVGSVLVPPPSGSGSEPSPSARCSQTPTIITRITSRTATTVTTRKPRRTIRKHLIIRPHGAVGAPLTSTITLVESRAHTAAHTDRRSARRTYVLSTVTHSQPEAQSSVPAEPHLPRNLKNSSGVLQDKGQSNL